MVCTEKQNKQEAYKFVKEKYKDISIPSWNRIEHTLHYVRFSNERVESFCDQISVQAFSNRPPNDVITVDESVFQCDPNSCVTDIEDKKDKKRKYQNSLSADKGPICDLPHKPAQQGILMYGAVSKTKNESQPFFYVIKIVFNPVDRGAFKYLKEILDSWPVDSIKPLLICTLLSLLLQT